MRQDDLVPMTNYEDVVLPRIRKMEAEGMSWREIEQRLDEMIRVQNIVTWALK